MENSKEIENDMLQQLLLMPDSIQRLESLVEYYRFISTSVSELLNMIMTFADNAREGCVLVQDNKLVWINKAAREMSGYHEENLIGRPIEEFIIPDMRDKMAARVKMTLAGDSLEFPQEWAILTGNRTTLWVNVFAYRVPYLGNPAILVFFYDVSAEKRASEERKLTAEIMDSVNDGVLMTELSGQIIYANNAFCASLGYDREGILKMNFKDIIAPEFRKKFDIRMKQFSIHKEAKFTLIALTGDGKRFPVEVMGKVVLNNGKQRLLCVSRDVQTRIGPEIELE